MGLGVTVDLGWPWWVTTIIAVAVAAAAVGGFFVTRHPVARGVLATLAVQGVVLAAVAPAVMDDGGAGSIAAMEPSAELTSADYARRADANCASLNTFAATLGNPTTLPGIEQQLDRMMPAFWNAWMGQGLLRPPLEERPVAGRWMNAMRSYGSSLEAVRYAAARGDKQGVNDANSLANRQAQDAAQLSSRLGMKVCFR